MVRVLKITAGLMGLLLILTVLSQWIVRRDAPALTIIFAKSDDLASTQILPAQFTLYRLIPKLGWEQALTANNVVEVTPTADGKLTFFAGAFRQNSWFFAEQYALDTAGRTTRLSIEPMWYSNIKQSPDGRWWLYQIEAPNGFFELMLVNGNTRYRVNQRLAPGKMRYDYPSIFSPDGQWLYLTMDLYGELEVARLNLQTGRAENLTEDVAGHAFLHSWLNGQLLMVTPGWRLAQMSPDSSGYRLVVDDENNVSNGEWVLNWAAGVLFMGRDDHILAIDFATGEKLWDGRGRRVLITPDEQEALIWYGRERVRRINLAQWNTETLGRGLPEDHDFLIEVSPDGKWWLYHYHNSDSLIQIPQLRVMAANGRDYQRVWPDSRNVVVLGWSADSEWILLHGWDRVAANGATGTYELRRISRDGKRNELLWSARQSPTAIAWASDKRDWVIIQTTTPYSTPLYRIRPDGTSLEFLGDDHPYEYLGDGVLEKLAWQPLLLFVMAVGLLMISIGRGGKLGQDT